MSEIVVGDRFGELVVIEPIHTRNHKVSKWLCRCDCGNTKIAYSCNLVSGANKSCGCNVGGRPIKPQPEISGEKYGFLTAIEFSHKNDKRMPIWLFRCDCGVEKKIPLYYVTSGDVKSCGCERYSAISKANIKGREKRTGTRLYHIYRGMVTRCCDTKSDSYKYYGGRGIYVCEEWLSDYETFKVWTLNNGYNETLSIDRIDNNGPYAPWNCRWATAIEQANNRRGNRLYEYYGETHSISEWARLECVNRDKLKSRLSRGASIGKALGKE